MSTTPLEPFVSAADLETYLERSLNEDKAVIAVDSACQQVRNLTGQDLGRIEDDAVTLDGTGTHTILLPYLPVVEVSSVKHEDEEVDADAYTVDLALGAAVTTGRRVWRHGYRNYSVTFSHGYEEIPTDVRVVALSMAARIYDQQLASSIRVGSFSVNYSSAESLGATSRELQLLHRHRKGR